MQSGTALVRAGGVVRPFVRPDGRYMRVASATQLKLHELCERKWGFTYPFKMKPPRTKAFEFGEMIHKQLEDYIESGTYPAHPLARTALPFIPQHGTIGVMGEYKGSLESQPKTEVKIDLTDISKLGLVRIVDYKTSKSEKYIPKPEELIQDTQAILYSYWAAQRYQVPVETTFLYLMKTGKPRAIPITIHPDLPYLQREWETRRARIAYMQAQYILEKPRDFSCVPNAPYHPTCQQVFGGCPFKERCALIEGGHRRLFAGITTATPNVSLMQQQNLETEAMKEEHRIKALFDRLHPADQKKILMGCTVQTVEALLCCDTLKGAVEAMEQWIALGPSLPTPEELEEKAALCKYALPMPALRMHPLERKNHWEMLPSGKVNPLDASPNQVPKKPDPRDRPVTSVPKIGDTVAERMALALGMAETEVPTVAQVAAEGLAFHKNVTGLSKTKMKEIIEICGEEAIAEEKARQEKAQAEVEATTAPAPAPGEMGETTLFAESHIARQCSCSAKALSPDQRFCHNCGSRFSADTAVEAMRSQAALNEIVKTEHELEPDQKAAGPFQHLSTVAAPVIRSEQLGEQVFYCAQEEELEDKWELLVEALWFKIGMNKTFPEDAERLFRQRFKDLLAQGPGL